MKHGVGSYYTSPQASNCLLGFQPLALSAGEYQVCVESVFPAISALERRQRWRPRDFAWSDVGIPTSHSPLL